MNFMIHICYYLIFKHYFHEWNSHGWISDSIFTLLHHGMNNGHLCWKGLPELFSRAQCFYFVFCCFSLSFFTELGTAALENTLGQTYLGLKWQGQSCFQSLEPSSLETQTAQTVWQSNVHYISRPLHLYECFLHWTIAPALYFLFPEASWIELFLFVR